MRAVITRVSSASVSVDGEVVGELPRPGLLVLAGVGRDDDAAAAKTLRNGGFEAIYILEGGINGWLAENLPVVSK